MAGRARVRAAERLSPKALANLAALLDAATAQDLLDIGEVIVGRIGCAALAPFRNLRRCRAELRPLARDHGTGRGQPPAFAARAFFLLFRPVSGMPPDISSSPAATPASTMPAYRSGENTKELANPAMAELIRVISVTVPVR